MFSGIGARLMYSIRFVVSKQKPSWSKIDAWLLCHWKKRMRWWNRNAQRKMLLNWKQDGIVPRKGEGRSIRQVVLQASENFLSLSCLPGWRLRLKRRGEQAYSQQHGEELRNKCLASGAQRIEWVKYITALSEVEVLPASSLDRANRQLRLIQAVHL